MAKLLACIPVFTVSSIDSAVAVYSKLGFTEEFRVGEPPFYAGVQRDGIGIHLNLDDGTGRVGNGACYSMVDDVNSLWDEFQEAGVEVIEPIGDRPYGMRDFYIRDGDGNSLGFGTSIESA